MSHSDPEKLGCDVPYNSEHYPIQSVPPAYNTVGRYPCYNAGEAGAARAYDASDAGHPGLASANPFSPAQSSIGVTGETQIVYPTQTGGSTQAPRSASAIAFSYEMRFLLDDFLHNGGLDCVRRILIISGWVVTLVQGLHHFLSLGEVFYAIGFLSLWLFLMMVHLMVEYDYYCF